MTKMGTERQVRSPVMALPFLLQRRWKDFEQGF